MKRKAGRPGETRLHNFAESLAASHAAEDLPLWREVYRAAFKDMTEMISHREDGEHQRAGIDRSIILKNSKQLLIDEKIRGRNKKTGKVYDDIALEFWSDRDNRIPGWVCKPLRADYIAYAIAPLGKCFLLPVPQLQMAWSMHGEQWKGDFRIIDAHNEFRGRRWVTQSVVVPTKTVFGAIGQCLRVQFQPTEAV